jgi:nucleoside-diphosphate-sugar epimerase
MTRNTRLLMGFRPERGSWASPEAGVYLVTGGAGFIGSHLVARLVAEGYRVRVLDDLSTGKKANLKGLSAEIEFVEGDVRKPAICRKACRGVAVVFHQAALPSVTRSLEDPFTTNEVNVGGTVNMLEAARLEGVRRFVFASSSSVYGDTPVLPKVESMHETPKSPYAASKLAGEKYCMAFTACHGLATVALRYFNVFGPRQDPDSPYAAVIPLFARALAEGRSPVIFGDGRQTRDFTFVEDVVQGNLLAAWSTDGAGEAFNIGAGNRHSLRALFEILARLTGSKLKPVYRDPRPGDVRDSQAGIAKARRILGFKPEFDLETGIRRVVESL